MKLTAKRIVQNAHRAISTEICLEFTLLPSAADNPDADECFLDILQRMIVKIKELEGRINEKEANNAEAKRV